MDESTLAVILQIGGVVLTALFSYVLYRLKQIEADIKESRDKALKAPSEDKVRAIVKDEIRSVDKNMDEIKKDMSQMAANLLQSIQKLESRIDEMLLHMAKK